MVEHRKQFEDSYQQELDKTQRDLNRLRLKMKQFDHCGDYDSVETYFTVIPHPSSFYVDVDIVFEKKSFRVHFESILSHFQVFFEFFSSHFKKIISSH